MVLHPQPIRRGPPSGQPSTLIGTTPARLNTAKAFENLVGNLDDQVRQVKNWNFGHDMRRRWAAAMVLDAERRFYKLKSNALLVGLINRLAKADLKAMIAPRHHSCPVVAAVRELPPRG